MRRPPAASVQRPVSLVAATIWLSLVGILYYRVYYAYTFKPLAHLPLAHKRMLIQHSTLPGQSAAHGSSATWARSQQAHAQDQAAGHAVHAVHHEQQAQQLAQQALDTSQQSHLAQEALHASKQRQQARHGPHSTQEPPHHVVSVCDDSCSAARNGKCDDGRQGNVSQPWLDGQVAWNHVRCDLGTDCADCGPAYIRLPLSSKQPTRPIQFLTERSIPVRIRQAQTQPPVLAAYTDPQADPGMSLQLSSTYVYEPGNTRALGKAVLGKGNCVRPDGQRRLVLDVGAGMGWYSVYAAVSGCRVMAWEPVPARAAFLQYALQANNVSHLVEMRTSVAAGPRQQKPKDPLAGTAAGAGDDGSGPRGRQFNVTWQHGARWGEVAVKELEGGSSAAAGNGSSSVTVPGELLDEVLLLPQPSAGTAAGSSSSGGGDVASSKRRSMLAAGMPAAPPAGPVAPSSSSSSSSSGQQAAKGMRFFGGGGAAVQQSVKRLAGSALPGARSTLRIGAAAAIVRRLQAAFTAGSKQEQGQVQGQQQEQQQGQEQQEQGQQDLDVLLLKVAADGSEPEVLAGARQLLASGAVENVLLDYNIGHAECAANWKRYGAYVDMLLELSTAGYRMAHLPETYALARVSDWAAPLPLFEEVAHGNLLYDKRDARLLKERKLGYPVDPYLAENAYGWDYGNSIPEDLHPKSLHASFSFSTTVWAARNGSASERALASHLGRRVGVLDWDAPLESFVGANSTGYSLGRKPCSEVAPSKQVKLRCPCSDAQACSKLQALVLERAKKHFMSEFIVPL